MMKFKVGDFVKTIKDIDCDGEKLFPIGTIGLVIEVDEKEEEKLPYRVFSAEEDDSYYYSEDMLKLAKDTAVAIDKEKQCGSITILDTGGRTTFASGAVRDMQEDKGSCELMPLDVVAELMPCKEAKEILKDIEKFKETGDCIWLYIAIKDFCEFRKWDALECILEVSMHYKNGKEKYGAYNWNKGIPVGSFISSSVRHLIKFAYDMEDERHDRSFIWNIFGAIWTMNHRPKMIDIPFEMLGSLEWEEAGECK